MLLRKPHLQLPLIVAVAAAARKKSREKFYINLFIAILTTRASCVQGEISSSLCKASAHMCNIAMLQRATTAITGQTTTTTRTTTAATATRPTGNTNKRL